MAISWLANVIRIATFQSHSTMQLFMNGTDQWDGIQNGMELNNGYAIAAAAAAVVVVDARHRAMGRIPERLFWCNLRAIRAQ